MIELDEEEPADQDRSRTSAHWDRRGVPFRAVIEGSQLEPLPLLGNIDALKAQARKLLL